MTEIQAEERSAPATPVSAWGALAIVTGALFLEGIDIAMLNVAVPSIAADIGLLRGPRTGSSAPTSWPTPAS